ncbi:class I SAM-dependent methyltransferase [Candidatus Sumerlaeota bacterium]|nr:class I SAM-dependent methyltransferase [Candidatus Sumerlaeota bacterium]
MSKDKKKKKRNQPEKKAGKKQKNKYAQLDFDKELTYGQKTYNKLVGEWWLSQAGDKAHRKAYKHIADTLKKLMKGRPQEVVADYACGSGALLWRLARKFKRSRVIGIDGSELMLKITDQVLMHRCPDDAARLELIESDLPNFELELQCDLIVYCFPNICPRGDDQPYYDEHGAMHKADRKAARALAKSREKNPDDETCFEKPKQVMMELLDSKVVSRNLHALLKPGGICARIEYSNAAFEELSELVQQRCLFSMGALDKPFEGHQAEPIFELLETTYHISDVIDDVYHQQGAEDEEEEGGYHINILRAI